MEVYSIKLASSVVRFTTERLNPMDRMGEAEWTAEPVSTANETRIHRQSCT